MSTIWGQALANATLLAAAPEMLAILRELRDKIPEPPNPYCDCQVNGAPKACPRCDESRALRARIETVIAKAEGRDK